MWRSLILDIIILKIRTKCGQMIFFPDKLFGGNILLNQYNILEVLDCNIDFIAMLLFTYLILTVLFLLMTYRKNLNVKEIKVL